MAPKGNYMDNPGNSEIEPKPSDTPADEEAEAMEEAQETAAEEREENGGYQ